MESHVLEHILDGREEPTNLPLELLKNITENFSEERKIGHGGFATVYKGVLPMGNVAVKRIRNGYTIDEKLFHGEVNKLLTLKHPNIVRFLGFCASTDQTAVKIEGSREYIYVEIRERLICLEYISNGNLQRHITDELRGLDWSTRYQVIKGICDGLHYLHMEKHICHMDLKPANILMDNDMVPKIADFGLSRLDEMSQTISLDRCGSLGYCAPEYLQNGKRSVKSDIYSLGIIITELVTGEKSVPDDKRNNVLRRWRHRWRKTGKESLLAYHQVTKCIDIGLLCQEIDPCSRPYISEIVRDLNEMEDTSSQISNDNESTIFQISPYGDDMLGIEPLELHFPFELNKEMSCSLELTNETDSYIAFEVQRMSSLPYCIEPHKGIVPPHSKCGVDITLQPKDKAPERADEFIVRSTRVNAGFITEHMTTAMFDRYMDNIVDEVNLDVFFDQVHPEPEAIVPQAIPGSSVLLDVYPLELQFLYEPKKLVSCSLNLTNNTDEQVTFGLLTKSDEQACIVSNLPMFGTVDPRTTYTLVVIVDYLYKELPQERNVDLILQSSTYYGILSDVDKCKQHFQNAEAMGKTVHKMTLKCVYALQGETTSEHSIPPSVKIIPVEAHHYMPYIYIRTIHANETEPLIITGTQSGRIHLWNYNSQEAIKGTNVSSFQGPFDSQKTSLLMNYTGYTTIPNIIDEAWSVKFIARMGWFLVGTNSGFMHVYNYKGEIKKIKSIKLKDSSFFKPSRVSLAIHPTQPYVLSAYAQEIKLWNWDHGLVGWKCIQMFEQHRDVVHAVAFNPEIYNFASASADGTIKVWSLDSPISKYTLFGHSEEVNCLDFFTHDDQQYLISGSNDKTAKIWDMQKKECVRTLPHRSQVRSVLPHSSLPLLVTGTEGGHVHLWSSTNFRLKRILDINGLPKVKGLVCLNKSGRVAVAHEHKVWMIEIRDDEDEGGSSKGNKENTMSSID